MFTRSFQATFWGLPFSSKSDKLIEVHTPLMESQLSETSLQTVSFSSYLRSVYKSTLFERVGLIRAGVPCGYFYDTAQAMGVSVADLARSLGVPLSLVYSIKSKGSPSQKRAYLTRLLEFIC